MAIFPSSNFAPDAQQYSGAPAEEDIAGLIRQMQQQQVRTNDQMVQLQRKLTETTQENSQLRNIIEDTNSRVNSRIDSIMTAGTTDPGTSWASQSWAQSYGGSPEQPKASGSAAPSKDEIAKMVREQLAQEQHRQQQEIIQRQQQKQQDGDRLWYKFSATHPELAKDPVFVARLTSEWSAAEVLNERANPNSRLNSDQLYDLVVNHTLQSYQTEEAYRQQAYQQQNAQIQQQYSGPNAVAMRHQAHQQQFTAADFQQPAAPSPYGAPYQANGVQLSGAQKTPQAPIPVANGQQGQGQRGLPYAPSTPYAPTAQQSAAQNFGYDPGAMDPRVLQHTQRLTRGPLPGM